MTEQQRREVIENAAEILGRMSVDAVAEALWMAHPLKNVNGIIELLAAAMRDPTIFRST